MNANKHEYIERDYTYKLVGCAMSVLNELGHGLREKTYERALCVEFDLHKIPYSSQEVYKVYYKGNHIDDYIPDLLIPKHLIVEVKTAEKICDQHI